MKNRSYFNVSPSGFTDIKIANVFSSSSASLNYELQSLSVFFATSSRSQKHAWMLDSIYHMALKLLIPPLPT